LPTQKGSWIGTELRSACDPLRLGESRLIEKGSWIGTEKCQLRASVDGIACANHLLDVGKKHALAKMQEAGAKKRGLGKKGVKLASGSGSGVPEAGAAE